MAGGFTLKAKFICSRDTFISLPPFYAERYNYISNQYGVFKCVRSVECDDTHFLIDSTFAEKLGIEEDESVSIFIYQIITFPYLLCFMQVKY